MLFRCSKSGHIYLHLALFRFSVPFSFRELTLVGRSLSENSGGALRSCHRALLNKSTFSVVVIVMERLRRKTSCEHQISQGFSKARADTSQPGMQCLSVRLGLFVVLSPCRLSLLLGIIRIALGGHWQKPGTQTLLRHSERPRV